MLDSNLLNRLYTESLPVKIKAPGTCGELAQGMIDGTDFLVNCPINRFSCATLRSVENQGVEIKNAQQHSKLEELTSLISDMFRLPYHHTLEINSDIPIGKGMASSSADLTATFTALTHYFGIHINHEFLAKVVTQIEPSDCVHFPNISQVNHLSGDLIRSFPAPLGMRVLVVDCGGEVNTISFDRDFARYIYRSSQDQIRQMLKLLNSGFFNANNRQVAKAATMSAFINQQILYKAPFEALLSCVQEVGALGVNCAHSGTVLGVLYEPSCIHKEQLVDCILKNFGNELTVIGDHNVIGGGYFES